MKKSNRSLTKDEISTFLSLLALEATLPKEYKQPIQRFIRKLQQIHLKLLSIFQCER